MAKRSTDELEEEERMIDVRGPRFSAAVTVVVLGFAFILDSVALVAFQALMFAIATFAGLRWSPYGNLFRLLKRRLDLGPPPEVEPEAPPRFAQACGFVFTVAGLAALLAGATTVGWSLIAVVLGLAAVLALTGLCIGCELYLLGQRLLARG
jgi:hypothetical protein